MMWYLHDQVKPILRLWLLGKIVRCLSLYFPSHFKAFICLWVWARACQGVCVEIRGHTCGSWFSFLHVSIENQTQVVRLGDKYLGPLRHLTSPVSWPESQMFHSWLLMTWREMNFSLNASCSLGTLGLLTLSLTMVSRQPITSKVYCTVFPVMSGSTSLMGLAESLELIYSVAPAARAFWNLSLLMSIPTILEAPAALLPMMTDRPTPPGPNTAQVEPGLTCGEESSSRS